MPRFQGIPVNDTDSLDFTSKYNTQLSPQEEVQFQQWAKQNDRLGDLYNYDMRGAWKEGASQGGNGHFTDKYKKPNHITFSDGSIYSGVDGNQAGKWLERDGKWVYQASPQQLKMHGQNGLKNYFAKHEKDAILELPSSAPRFKGVPVQESVSEQPASPIDGMSNTDLAMAGAGKFVVDSGRGLQQLQAEAAGGVKSLADGGALGDFKIPGTDIPIGPGLIRYAPSVQIANYIASKLGINDDAYRQKLQAEIDDAKKRDAALMDTTAGKVGYAGGGVATGLPLGMVQGANTLAGAMVAGGATGLAQPAASDDGSYMEKKAKDVAIGAGAGAVGQAVGQAIGAAGRALSVREATRQAARQAVNAEKDATLRAAQQAGYVVPPAMTQGNMVGKLLSGLSGKAKTEQLARIRNQPVTDRLARQALGIQDEIPITEGVTRAVRQAAYDAGYRPVAAIGQITTDADYVNALNRITQQQAGAIRSFPQAAQNDIAAVIDQYRVPNFLAEDGISQIQVIRDQASDAFRTGNTQLGRALRSLSTAMEDQIERHLQNSGRNGQTLLREFREARRMMARAHTVESAIREGSGSVDPAKFAEALRKGKPLDGELETIGRFANTFREVGRMPSGADANPLTVLDFTTGGVGAGLTAASTPAGAALMALPAARVASRYGVLSGAGQRMFTQPNYGPTMLQRTGNALASPMVNPLLRLAGPGSIYAAQE